MTLSASKLQGLVAGLAALYSPVSRADYPACVVGMVTGMVTCDSCSYTHLGPYGPLAWYVEPADAGVFFDTADLLRQRPSPHPVTGCYRRGGIRYRAAVMVLAPDEGLIGVAVNRWRRDFSDDEVELLDLLRPHIQRSAAICHLLTQPALSGLPGLPGLPGVSGVSGVSGLPDGNSLITARQARILQLVAAGKPDRAIGRALGISTRTVHAHLQNIYRALNVTSRTEALARLRDISLDSPV